MKEKNLTHFDKKGDAQMVDITPKLSTERKARARGRIFMKKDTLNSVNLGSNKKGDVLGIARIAGIMAAKKTSELIPLCHSISLSQISIDFSPLKRPTGIDIEVNVKTNAQTGVEMEALTALSVASLTIYDMLKAIDKEMEISDIHLSSKTGGKSGTFKNNKRK